MNELNEKAINMCQVMIGFKPGVSDGDIQLFPPSQACPCLPG